MGFAVRSFDPDGFSMMLNRLCLALIAAGLLSLFPRGAQRSAADDEAAKEESPPVASVDADDGDTGSSLSAAAKLQFVADPESLRALIDRARQSVVVITFSGRNEYEKGLGSGFILRKDGLIATNLHVIGEARPISVKLLDGRTFEVTEVYATEKAQDLAILKVDAQDLPAMPLGDVDSLRQGDPLIAVGNPEGLTHSVVTGVAGIRDEVQGMDMIQLAMPIERGNSGGPVINLQGQVVGLVTLKSLAKENVGFAVAANHLLPLIEKPNPVTMSNWLTIGVLNPRLWETPRDSNRWNQRAGRIHAAGSGRGFGGRSLCLSRQTLPDIPYEVSVSIKMEEDDGAAGLIFFGDGEDRHYGFYPSTGKLRLTQFDGPTVYEWNVLRDERTPHYKPDEWANLKVRVEEDRFLCYCNDELIYDLRHDPDFNRSGRVGLAKFRHTTAEFKGFRIGRDLPSSQPDPTVVRAVTKQVRNIPTGRPPGEDLLSALSDQGGDVQSILERRAKLLERQAERLRQLADGLHARKIAQQLAEELHRSSDEIDLLRAALLVAALDSDELDIVAYEQEVQALADDFLASLGACASEQDRLAAFQTYLFDELGFHGSRTNYYSASNSYLNEVIDDREGLPITLSVLYIELARRCGLDVVGVGLPHHFLVRFEPQDDGEAQLIDPFDRGRELSEAEAVRLVESHIGGEWIAPSFDAQRPRAIILRILQNLINVSTSRNDAEASLRYVDAILAINPESPQHRLFKAVLCLNTGRIDEGLAETEWVLERQPEEVAIEQVYRLKGTLEAMRSGAQE
ncbi:MAG: trypsin-like peptidase domain-containing protein [Planctomycetaceae bacterium]|nr:trypsin-like peptidase domain-containing protein [Planctomycetaceae bacterium]